MIACTVTGEFFTAGAGAFFAVLLKKINLPASKTRISTTMVSRERDGFIKFDK
jgi:hypothetical protein